MNYYPMLKQSTFDVIVVGSGSAGFSAVEAAVTMGARVCLIEKGKLGGECPNDACIPSKTLLRAAAVYRLLGRVREFGIDASGRSFDWKKIQDNRERVVETITGKAGERYLSFLKKWKVAYKKGEAKFVDANTLDVDGGLVRGRAIVLATGTDDFIPPINGLRDIRFWGWREALTAPRQPKSMAIIGGGPVACEIATFYASFGTRVIILQSAPRILNREDDEISGRAAQALEALGIEVVTGAEVLSCVNGGMGAVGLNVEFQKRKEVFAVEAVVVAAGKRPVLPHMAAEWLEKPHIFVAGDADGGPMFTHTAHHEGWIAGHEAARLALRKRGSVVKRDERVVPRVTFVDPEVASVGMTQLEATNTFKKALVGRYETGSLGRRVTDHAGNGLIKLIAHPTTRKLVGAHAICPHAGELIHEAAMVIYVGATIDKIASMIHAYPTYAEGLRAAASLARVE